MDKEKIIDYDFQGWPVFKFSLRDIFERLCKHEDGKYFIEDNDPILDIFPKTLEDDGMGYGVNDMLITGIDTNTEEKYINVWVGKPYPNIELWMKSKIRPWVQSFMLKKDSPNYKEGRWYASNIREGEEGFEYEANTEDDENTERIWIKESEIDNG